MDEQLVIREKRALELVPMSRTKFRELLESGEVPSFHVGRARLIPLDGLRKWVIESVANQSSADRTGQPLAIRRSRSA
jgi:excisionase family DNA binding protein